MGKRLHVAKKWQVEFADGEFGFNYAQDKFVEVMNLLGCDVTSYEPETECAGELECDMEEFEAAIENLRNLNEIGEDDRDELDELLESVGLDRKRFLAYLESMLEKAKTENLAIDGKDLEALVVEALDKSSSGGGMMVDREKFLEAFRGIINANSYYNRTMHFSFY